MIVIELTEKVVMEFLDRRMEFLETSHLPFKEFSLKFPMSVFLTEGKVLSDSLGRLPVPPESLTELQMKKIKKVAKDYSNSELTVNFKYDGVISIDIVDSLKGTLFSMETEFIEIMYIPKIKVNSFATDEFSFSFRILSLIAHVINYISEPKKEVLVSERREPKNTGKKGKKKSGGKTYIYKKTYKVLDIETKLEKRDYNRIKESWGVRGHWRTYKSGKRVWIEEHTKGNKDTDSGDKTYKVSRLD